MHMNLKVDIKSVENQNLLEHNSTTNLSIQKDLIEKEQSKKPKLKLSSTLNRII